MATFPPNLLNTRDKERERGLLLITCQDRRMGSTGRKSKEERRERERLEENKDTKPEGPKESGRQAKGRERGEMRDRDIHPHTHTEREKRRKTQPEEERRERHRPGGVGGPRTRVSRSSSHTFSRLFLGTRYTVQERYSSAQESFSPKRKYVNVAQ